MDWNEGEKMVVGIVLVAYISLGSQCREWKPFVIVGIFFFCSILEVGVFVGLGPSAPI